MTSAPSWSVPDGLARSKGPYSLCSVTYDGWIHTGGLVAMDPVGNVIAPGDVQGQIRAIFAQADTILAAAGASLADVVFLHVFLTDMGDYAGMNQAYREVFAGLNQPFPPRYCVRADLIRPDLLVEIAFVAKLRSGTCS